MKTSKILMGALSIALLPLAGAASAHENSTRGYAVDSRGHIARNSYNECYRTGFWTPDMAIPECDPGLVKKPAPVSQKLITIEGANFDTNSAKLKPEASKQLDEVVDFAAKHKDANLDITGYTDNRGSDKLNQDLSARRAESVKAYLVKKGVAADRLTIKGEGAGNPVGDNGTKEGRAQNRRVEIRAMVR
jgi:OOP family OmpA-OmpF porin